jgi:hypothetical protein
MEAEEGRRVMRFEVTWTTVYPDASVPSGVGYEVFGMFVDAESAVEAVTLAPIPRAAIMLTANAEGEFPALTEVLTALETQSCRS